MYIVYFTLSFLSIHSLMGFPAVPLNTSLHLCGANISLDMESYQITISSKNDIIP